MKTKSKIMAFMLVVTLIFSGSFVPANAAKVKVKKVTVASSLSASKKNVIIAKGKSVKLATTVKVTPNKKANKKVTYSVKNKKIATVSSKGVVTGKKTGTTTVTVTSKKNKKKKATITVKVVKGAVKKVTLNKKKASLKVGETLKLKAKVKAEKGAVKTIAYVSSKPKVAKVNKKGVITAVGSGSAKITARAIDGSGKKAAIKISVSNPINLAGMNVPNERTVSFSLDKPLALNPAQVSIAKKIHASGTYNNQLIINNMTTADNVNYTAVLSNDTDIDVGDFVQVAVPSLSGTVKSLEMEYKDQLCAFTGEEISKWKVGTYSTDSFYFSSRGYSSYALSGVPAGLTYEIKNNSVKVKGTPTVAGSFDFVLSATDEWGNTLSRTIHFIVGSDTVIAGASGTDYDLIGADEATTYFSLYDYFTGGSGSYTYSVVADPQGVVYYGYDNPNHTIGSGLNLTAHIAGVYTVTVRATDSSNHTCDVNLVWNVKQGISVGGCLKDGQGNPMTIGSNGRIIFTNKDRASKYSVRNWATFNSETSTYSALLEPGIYDIEASYNGSRYYDDDGEGYEAAQSTTYLYSQSLTASQTGYDIQLGDLYKVALTGIENQSSTSYWTPYWYVNHESVGSGSTLYLKPGSYTIESSNMTDDSSSSTSGDWFNGTTTTTTTTSSKLTASFTIVNAAVQAAVSKAASGTPEIVTSTRPAAKNTTYMAYTENDYNYWLDETGDYYAYKFTPTETGKYKISNSTVYFYNMDGTKAVDDENGYYNLTADTSYIVGTGNYNSSASFNITKKSETITPAE